MFEQIKLKNFFKIIIFSTGRTMSTRRSALLASQSQSTSSNPTAPKIITTNGYTSKANNLKPNMRQNTVIGTNIQSHHSPSQTPTSTAHLLHSTQSSPSVAQLTLCGVPHSSNSNNNNNNNNLNTNGLIGSIRRSTRSTTTNSNNNITNTTHSPYVSSLSNTKRYY